jgi:hypothetical protein
MIGLYFFPHPWRFGEMVKNQIQKKFAQDDQPPSGRSDISNHGIEIIAERIGLSSRSGENTETFWSLIKTSWTALRIPWRYHIRSRTRLSADHEGTEKSLENTTGLKLTDKPQTGHPNRKGLATRVTAPVNLRKGKC